MFDRYFSGLKLSSAALALLLIAAGLYFGACSSDKGEKTETVEQEETVEVVTPEEPAATEAPGRRDIEKPKSAEGAPPEITAGCADKSEGDECVITTAGGKTIPGKCIKSRKDTLNCMPQPIPVKSKAISPGSKPASPEPSTTE